MADPLEELRKRLYKKEGSFEARLRRPELTPHPEKAPLSWKEETMPKSPPPYSRKRLWIIFFSLIFLAAAGGIFYFFIFSQAVSSRKIDLVILAPDSAVGGERIVWEVALANNNKKALESSELVFEYPPGSKILESGARGLRLRKSLGRIGAGEIVKISFSAFLFGFEGEEKRVRASLEYRPEDSSAILVKEGELSTFISRAPVGISFELPSEIRAGQELEVKINYVSNSESTLENLMLELETPPGFAFKKSTPLPEAGGRSWKIGSLEPGEKGSIIVGGVLSGGELEEKSFKARTGVKDNLGDFSVYGQGVGTLTLRRPFLEVDAKVNGADSYVARPGESLEAEIFFKNNLSVPVQNVVIEGTFLGRGLDERQIRVRDGNYRSADKKIIWNASSADSLRQLEPGKESSFRLQFAFLEDISVRTSADREFKVVLSLKITPGILPSGFFGTDVTGEDILEMKLATRLQLVRRGFYFSPLVSNSGPMPPKVGQETTFSVTWSLINSTNDLENVLVRSSLPSYMNWKGILIPGDAAVNYDPNSGEILWRVGELKAGVGYLSPARELTFQIGFVPSSNQVGQAPDLIPKVTAEGKATFIDSLLSVEAPALTLELEDDPKIEIGQTRVVP